MTRSPRAISFVLIVGSMAWSTHGLAQDPMAAARAEMLFREGKDRLAAGDLAAACPKFEEAQRLLVRGIGVTLFLGACYEKSGRAASAWAQYKKAESFAEAQDDPRAKVAHARAAAVEPHVAKVSLVVSDGDLGGLEITLDGVAVGRPAWGSPLPVDPGKHALHASAPGKTPWDGSVTVAAEGSARFEIPKLVDAPPAPNPVVLPSVFAPPAPAASEPASSTPAASRKVSPVAWVGFGVGAVGLGVGAVTGALALAKASDVKGACPDFQCPSSESQNASNLRSEQSTGQAFGTVSTIAFVLGGAGVATGIVGLVLRPRSKENNHLGQLSPWIAPGAAGLRGTF